MATSSFNTNAWKPNIRPGYFYIGGNEYYLYENKQVLDKTASLGTITLPSMRFINEEAMFAPIVVTDVGDYDPVAASSVPFTKTYEPPIGTGSYSYTPDKYRRVYDLSGLQESVATPTGLVDYDFELADHQFVVRWGDPDDDGYYTPQISIIPSSTRVVIEYEDPEATDGYYIVDDLDLNPNHSPFIGDSFIVLTDSDTTPAYLDIFVVDRAGPQAIVNVCALVRNIEGAPLQGVDVQFQASATGPGRGSFVGALANPHTTATDWDGTAYAGWNLPSYTANTPVRGITITASTPEATGSVTIPIPGSM